MKEGGRGFAGMEDCVDASILALKEYNKKTKERLITVVSKIIGYMRTSKREKITETQKPKWGGEKQLCRYFKQQTGKIAP